VKATKLGLKMPMAPEVAPSGITTCAWVSLTTVTDAFFAMPTEAVLVPLNPLPLTTTTVPTGPEPGVKLMMPGWA
jgi:hypothetical protein